MALSTDRPAANMGTSPQKGGGRGREGVGGWLGNSGDCSIDNDKLLRETFIILEHLFKLP